MTEPAIIEKFATKSECWATNVYQKSLPPNQQNKNYRKFYECRPMLFLHSLGYPQDNADIQADRWNNPNGQAIAHACVDARDGKTRQALPWDFRGWHAGTEGNNCAIGVEMAESLSIKYTGSDKFEILDLAKAQANCRTAYNGAVELFAWLCQRFGIDPLGKREIGGKLFPEIMSHNEWNRLRGVSGHTDPEHYWTGLDMPYTMDGFRAAVKDKLAETPESPETGFPFVDVPEKAYYRKAVEWAYATGITAGTSKTMFSPDRPITRAEAVTMMRKLYKLIEGGRLT